MIKQEMEKIIADELGQFEPKELSRASRSLWRMWFNALRENDLAKGNPSGGKITAVESLIDILLQGKCDSYETVPVEKTSIITVICVNPKEDIKVLLTSATTTYGLLKNCRVDEISTRESPQGLVATKLELRVSE